MEAPACCTLLLASPIDCAEELESMLDRSDADIRVVANGEEEVLLGDALLGNETRRCGVTTWMGERRTTEPGCKDKLDGCNVKLDGGLCTVAPGGSLMLAPAVAMPGGTLTLAATGGTDTLAGMADTLAVTTCCG